MLKFANFAQTTLVNSIASTDTTFAVASTSQFPPLGSGDQIVLALGESPTVELVRCVAISGSVLTVVRGQEGTSAVAWSAGTPVRLVVSAGVMGELYQRSGGLLTGDVIVAKTTPRVQLADQPTSATATIEHVGVVSNASDAIVRVDAVCPTRPTNPPPGHTQALRLQVGRQTTAHDGTVVEIYAGDGTSTQAHSLRGTGAVYLALPASGRVGVGTTTPVCSLDVAKTDALRVPVGGMATRPTSPVVGMLRYNSDLDRFEGYRGTGWGELGGGAGAITVTPQRRLDVVTLSTGSVVPADKTSLQLEYVAATATLTLVEVRIDVTGTNGATVTLPTATQGAAVGQNYWIRNASNGVLTINAPAGSTINGASFVTVPWHDGVVSLDVSSITGSNVVWTAYGDTADGVTLPAATVLGSLVLRGEVSGGRTKVGPTISANTTLDTVADVNVIRHVVASGVTVTVPAEFRGRVDLWFEAAGTLVLTSGPTHNISAGQRVIVDVHQVGSSVYRAVYPLTALT